ncbi:MAG: penicillin acylase family protein [Betaproteobacteria bacterium]|nr:penicillin acylase family protein [Betaproteobacteria bacterium]
MKRILRIASWLLAAIVLLAAVIALAGWLAMRASLPTLDGNAKLTSLAAPVAMTRDQQGTVAIAAQNSLDAIRTLGYVHAQERFFEMDLARRSAAGELSALLGPATLSMDKDKRRHRLRTRMEAQLKLAPAEERAWLAAYVDGVNQGLNALSARPWQYLILRAQPEPWRDVDSLLVVGEMYFMLQSGSFEGRFADIRLRQMLGDRIFEWLQPLGGEWDAALDGSAMATAALPTAAEIDLRKLPAKLSNLKGGDFGNAEILPGSNNWAVGGSRTAHGAAILADDMHLGLGVPSIWFRTQLTIGSGAQTRRVAGVTLPGVPSMVVGSNGDVAWGFTNSYGQWFDWVTVPKAKTTSTPVASSIAVRRETIAVKGGDNVEIEVREAAFGPVLREDAANEYALAWSLYRDGAVNTRASAIMFAKTVDEALALAQESGIPHQNFLTADRAGNLAWTIMGRIPARAKPAVSRGTTTPADALPTAWLPAASYPVVKNPKDGQLWTANSRQLGGEGAAIIGEGGFDLGARAGQIRDRLSASPKLDEKALYDIQLDAESRFLKRWSELAQSLAGQNEKAAALVAELKRWNGRADIDQTGHRIARAFRQRTLEQLWLTWLAAADRTPPNGEALDKRYAAFSLGGRFEYPAWRALTERPLHLLPQPHKSWDEFLAAQLAFVHDELIQQSGSLAEATWGKRNATRIKHPFSRAMPFLSRFLDMPSIPQAGDNHMPRVATPTFGASQRLVVSPGREEQGILTVAGGQSGHPLSPFYGAGHRDWLDGKPTPLLAGETRHTLQLSP